MGRRLILASASPRRRELLSLLGLPFMVLESNIPEPGYAEHQQARIDSSPNTYAEELALSKATEVFNRVRFGDIAATETDMLLVLAADTVVITETLGAIE